MNAGELRIYLYPYFDIRLQLRTVDEIPTALKDRTMLRFAKGYVYLEVLCENAGIVWGSHVLQLNS